MRSIRFFNSRVFPGIDPLPVRAGDRVRIRFGNLTMTNHPIHLHGYHFEVAGTDGGWIAPAARWPEVTTDVAVGQMRAIEFIANRPGDWAFHCHKSHHTMNAMGHQVPNMIGVPQQDLARRINRLVPDYMAMGSTGGAMGEIMAGPGFEFELELLTIGEGPVAGVDEAGRGPLAGPVAAAAVILDSTFLPEGVDDSKKLAAPAREILYDRILDRAVAVGIGFASVAEIERINIRAASLLAMFEALMAEVRRTGADRVLVIDHTLGVVPAEAGLRQLAASLAGLGFGAIRLAYVDARGTAVSRMELGEIIGREHGYDVRVFDNPARARIWLHYGSH